MRLECWLAGFLAVTCLTVVKTEESCHYIEVIGDLYCRGVPTVTLRSGHYPMNVSKIIKLDISSAQIALLECDVFEKRLELLYLDMNDNSISKLDTRLFLQTNNLQKLFVARNRISILQDEIFSSLSALTHLDISGNQLQKLSDQIFMNQKNLIFLYANSIGISSVPTEIIETLTSLRTLELNDNDIKCSCCLKNITKWAKQKCLSLQVNCIGRYGQRSNSIEAFTQNFCGKKPVTRKPNYPRFPYPEYNPFYDSRNSDNGRGRVHWDDEDEYRYNLRKWRNREHFFFDRPQEPPYQDACSNDSLVDTDPTPIDCPKRHCRYLNGIKQMNCDAIPLRYLDPKQYPFEEREFTDFILDNNELARLDSDTFNAFEKLFSLSLRKNNIESLESNVFKNLKKLRFLDISDNRLGNLWNRNLFASQKRLQALYLSNNRIAGMHSQLFEPLVRPLKRLFLLGNPLNCDCNMRPVYFSIADTKIIHKATCMYPVLYREENWEILRGATYCRLATHHVEFRNQTTAALVFFGSMFLLVAFTTGLYYGFSKLYDVLYGDKPVYIPDDFELY